MRRQGPASADGGGERGVRCRTPASPRPASAATVCDVFGMGFTEILMVGIVVLILFSPKELPGVLKSVAKVYGSLRRTAEEFRAQVMESEELREPIDEIRSAYHGTRAELQKAQAAARRELTKARLEARMAEQRLAQLAREEAGDGRVSTGAPVPASPVATSPAAATTSPAADAGSDASSGGERGAA